MTKASDVYVATRQKLAYPEWDKGVSGFERARTFHESMGLPINEPGYEPTVSERILRGKLLLEEVIEHIEKGLGLRLQLGNMLLYGDALELIHREGDLYDPVETLDGLADIKVISNGTAVAFGLPMEEADWEVFCSNMTKLDEDGKPIVNRCTVEPFTGHDCEIDGGARCVLIDESKPVGKLLKPPHYTPANIAAIIEESKK